jgi:hypothetical protein
MTDNILEKGCLVQFSVSIWGGRIKLPSNALNLPNVNPEFIRATKHLIDRACLRPLEEIRNAARGYVYQKSLPFPIPGILFVPSGMIPEIDNKLREFKEIFEQRVAGFLVQYDVFVSNAADNLGDLFDPSEYPADIEKRFGFNWRFFTLAPPSKKLLLDPALIAQEQQKFRQTIAEFSELATSTLRGRFAELVDHIVERLAGPEKKVFRDSLIGNIRQFLEDFERLNINGDIELANLVARCREIIGGTSPQMLRDNDAFRQAIGESMQQLQNTLDEMMVDRPTRKIIKLKDAAA